MDKNSIKDLIQIAKQKAEKGAQFAGETAKKAAEVVSESVNEAKETLQYKVAMNKTADTIHDCINELEKENEKFTPEDKWGDVYTETKNIITRLESVYETIKNDFENCNKSIDALSKELIELKNEIITNNAYDESKTAILVKRYDRGISACSNAVHVFNEHSS